MALMLTTRTVVPLLSLALPAILAFTLSTIGVAGLSGFYVALALFAASTGIRLLRFRFLQSSIFNIGQMIIVVVTLFVKPYRRSLLNLLCVGKVKAKLGIVDNEVTTMTTKSGKRVVNPIILSLEFGWKKTGSTKTLLTRLCLSSERRQNAAGKSKV